MIKDGRIWFAADEDGDICLLPGMANRHGIITGATGTGKTVTMKVLAESFSVIGVPVFLCDVKGDVSGICEPGADSESMQKRIAGFGIEGWQYKAFPTRMWDIFGEKGIPLRIKTGSMGASGLARILSLTEAQTGVLEIAYRFADDNGLMLYDYKDLKALLEFMDGHIPEVQQAYGHVTKASIGVVRRALLRFEDECTTDFFGEPELDIRDLLRTDFDGRGYINLINCEKLIGKPTLYATFLFWLLTELFERLPEIGDPDRPRMVFFFDEAHLLFEDAPKAFIQKIEQACRLIRSKGVGIYFVTQSPADVPGSVLAQLSNRIQHALRAYTPAEQKSIKAAASAFRTNPAFNTAQAISELGVGEALVSCLDASGTPQMVRRAKVLPPQSNMSPCEEATRSRITAGDEFELKYREAVDSESAFEILEAAAIKIAEEEARQEAEAAAERERIAAEKAAEKERIAAEKAAEKERLAEERAKEKERIAAEKQAEKERIAAEKQAAKEAAAAEKAAEKERIAAEKAAEKERIAAEKAAQKEAEAKKRAVQRATSAAASTVSTAVTRNIVSSLTGGKTTSTGTIAKRAAANAATSIVRSGTNGLMRGLFGNLK